MAIVLMLVIAAVDVLLVRFAERQKGEHSRLLFTRAEDLARDGRHEEALELFRAAYNQRPDSPEYQLAFLMALNKTGRRTEARRSLESLLDAHPANGPANIEMARMLKADGQWEEAAWYYQRGLYGQWPAESSPDLTNIRLELADLLAEQGARQELLSELVLLNAELTDRPELASHYGQLLLAAGNWTEAQRMYRSLIRSEPKEPQHWSGLARAQFGSGDYIAAQRSLRRAVALAPDDSELEHELETVTEILALDPTQRRLGSTERQRRSHHLVTALMDALEQCTSDPAKLSAARETLEKRKSLRTAADRFDSDLDLLEHLYNSREEICPAGVSLAPAVQLTIEHVLR